MRKTITAVLVLAALVGAPAQASNFDPETLYGIKSFECRLILNDDATKAGLSQERLEKLFCNTLKRKNVPIGRDTDDVSIPSIGMFFEVMKMEDRPQYVWTARTAVFQFVVTTRIDPSTGRVSSAYVETGAAYNFGFAGSAVLLKQVQEVIELQANAFAMEWMSARLKESEARLKAVEAERVQKGSSDEEIPDDVEPEEEAQPASGKQPARPVRKASPGATQL